MPEKFTNEQLDRLSFAIITAAKALEKQIEYTNDVMKKRGVTFTAYALPDDSVAREAVTSLKNKLNRHVNTYGVHQADIDFYKVTAWFGMMLYKNQGKPPTFQLLDLVGVLNAELIKDNRSLPLDILSKIATMAKNDEHQHNDDLAIGMNGLYMIFRACYKLGVTSPPNP